MTHFEELLHLRIVRGHDDGANARCEARCGGAGTARNGDGGVDDAFNDYNDTNENYPSNIRLIQFNSIQFNSIQFNAFAQRDDARHCSSETPGGGTTKTPNSDAAPSRYTFPSHP